MARPSVRVGLAVVAIVGVVSFAMGGGASSAPHHAVKRPDVVMNTVAPQVAPIELATSVLDPTSRPSTHPARPVAVAYVGTPSPSELASDGIPTTALQAYQRAAAAEASVDPTCRLPWVMLAGIGRVESDHGLFGGATLYTNGESVPHVIGIPLNGVGTALVRDTDRGHLDGDTVFDNAVGPMQFIPATWKLYGVDSGVDRHRDAPDPFNIFDAAATAARYLCATGADLSTAAGQTQGLLSYNDSTDYVKLVVGIEDVYAREWTGVAAPTLSGAVPSVPKPKLPPADPGGHPLGVSTPSPTPSASPGRTGTPSSAASSPAPTVSPTVSPSVSPSSSTSPPTSPSPSPAPSPSSSSSSPSQPPSSPSGSP